MNSSTPRGVAAAVAVVIAALALGAAAPAQEDPPDPQPRSAPSKQKPYFERKCGPAVKKLPRQINRKRYQRTLLCLIQAARKKKGRGRLKPNRKLERAARKLARISHRKQCGACPRHNPIDFPRKKGYRGPVGALWSYGAEWGSVPLEVIRTWNGTYENRSVLQGRAWKRVGIGVVFGRRHKITAVAFFGA